MGVIWNKVWFDLWHNKARTLLAVLSIAAGVFAVGAMFGMADQLTTTLDSSHRSVIPPHIQMGVSTYIDRDTALNLRRIPGVEDVQPYNEVLIRYKLHPQDPWKQGVIHMVDDYNNQKYELVQLRQGRWPKKDDIGVERMAAQFLNIGIGDKVIFKIGETERVLPISGLIRHPFVPPPQFQDLAFFFMDGEGLERFDVPQGKFGGLFVRVTPYSPEHARQVATAIKQNLAKQDVGVSGIAYQEPDKHWGRAIFDGINLVLEVLAVISLLTSAVLVYNTVTALITQQTDQIGILKAIGGRTGTIVQVYLSAVFVYGLLALLIALPLGAALAYGMSRYMLNLFNIDYPTFRVSNQAVVLQVVSALVVPLLAGLLPILHGAGISVRQAIASYGLGGDFGSSWIDRGVEGIGQRLLPSHYATALGNMFRRKGRLVLTQLVLISAGIMFLMVMSLSSSITKTLDGIFARRNYDTTLQFDDAQRVDRVTAIAQEVQGVDKVEVRMARSATLRTEGQSKQEAGLGETLYGIPDGSDFFSPLMVAGRWLQPGDGRVTVIARETAEKNNIHVGDHVTLDLGNLSNETWEVVGLYEPIFTGGFNSDTVYVPAGALYDATKRYNQGGQLNVRTDTHDGKAVAALTTRLKDLFESRNMKVGFSQTEYEIRQTNEFQFSIVTTMLLILAVVVAMVGGISLMGALSISVVERTKEIGVMRAVGARSRTIMGMFVMEGLWQGLLSWLIAFPVSFVVSRPLAGALGQAMFSANLDYQYNMMAVGVWLVIIFVISTLASLLPARSATLVSVRTSLAYA